MPAPPSKPPSKPSPAADKSPRDTPAMRQYFAFKKSHPDCVLFFRMGDFYEMFDEDAVTAHKALGITLTERTAGVPMAGVPYHAVDGYLRRMIEQGYRVAVCEQIQDPKEAKGVVERAVTRVLTPGTLVDESLLADDAPSNLAAIAFLDSGDSPDARVGVAIIELATGAFTIFETTLAAAADELARRAVTELLYLESPTPDPPPRLKPILAALSIPATPRPGWHFRHAEALEALLSQYAVASLAGFGIEDTDPLIAPAGAIIRYLHETQNLDHHSKTAATRALSHLAPPARERTSAHVAISATSLRALEVERTIRADSTDGALLGVYSGPAACRTPMGRRLLREWLCRPLAERAPIEARQRCVATFVEDRRTADAVAESTARVQDVARIAGRLGMNRATPRDLVALGASVAKLTDLAAALENAPAFADHRDRLLDLAESITPLAETIAAYCVDEPPAHLREGGLFRDSIDAELDECRALQRDGAAWLSAYQKQLIEQHDLPNIKVGFNQVLGYYIELTAAQARRAPDTFTRKQTLQNAERYITPELKEYEDKVTTAEARAIAREQHLFAELCARAAAHAHDLAAYARTVAELDCLAAFAARAHRSAWIRPEITDDPVLDITQGRHPALDQILADQFVPNDISLGTTENPAPHALNTGPNIAGKTTNNRQAALLTHLAHPRALKPAQ
ncbi:MAG: DNA mismatch repair protein MutS, partial [Planctomycetota bacterium]|nr:DNA mismatch repair protein MutS [Planctomycetota bacterium]